jgi:hypothetical protein
MNWALWLAAAAGAALAAWAGWLIFRGMRHAVLLAKYGDDGAAERIIDNQIWRGMTAEQLTEVMGAPEEKDRRVLKTKTVEVWKYGRTGANRFRWRVTLEEGVVTGWEAK